MTESTKSEMTDEDWMRLGFQVSEVFTPAAPVNEDELFAGRLLQINKVIEAINQVGQHVVIYGERGVGKTSLANILQSRIKTVAGNSPIAPRVNCNNLESYGAIWAEVFRQLPVTRQKRLAGFKDQTEEEPLQLLPTDHDEIGPNLVCNALAKTVRAYQKRVFYIILDEFDRVPNGKLKRAIADTIKTLSDQTTRVTIIIVGVADTVGALIAEHQSIERATTQVLMPRMKSTELYEILDKGTSRLSMDITTEAKQLVAGLSKGLPSYTHRLALKAARFAIADHRLSLGKKDVAQAVKDVVFDTDESLYEKYQQAVASSQPNNRFEQVLLACACAQTGDRGYFLSSEIRTQMAKIMGEGSGAKTYDRHLKKFCEEERGPMLKQEAFSRRYRYRFINPLMQPFIIMRGIVAGRLSESGSIIPRDVSN